ncbi:putative major capsid protein [Bacillus phage PBC5]|nr:putative major capsid protein [Bacillus phage PBC5]
MPLHLDQFKDAAFQGYIDNVPPARKYLLAAMLPAKPVYDIKFAYNVINRVYARTASITGFNADAPLRDKDGLAKAFGEVAKVQHGFRLEEEELLRFNQPRNEGEKQQAIDYVYDQTDNLITGVRDIEEWMRAQVLYTGQLVYNEGKININVDYGIPSANKMTAAVTWATAATATPLTDIAAAVEQFKSANNGKTPTVMHMRSQVEAKLLKSEQIKAQVYGSPTDKRLLTKGDIANVFSALSLPPYEINDDMIDNGAGATYICPTDRVVLFGDNLGNTFFGPTVEKNYQTGMYVLPIVHQKPPRQEVYVGETVFPALSVPQAIAWINV